MLRDNGFVDIFTPVLSLEDAAPLPPPEPRGPRSTKFIIPWPLHLSASSASLQTSVPFPLSGYRNGLCHSRVILTDPQTFPAFSAHLSRIAAFSPPGASLCALPSSFHKDYSHHLAPYGGLATPTWGYFGAYSVRSRYGPPGCSPPYKKAFTSELSAIRSPSMTVGYNYVAKLGIATVGLSPR